MGSLFLIRHGQASYGEPDYDRLSTRGIAQARALGAHLASARLGTIYVGPHVRQRQTFEHAAATGSLPAAIELAGLAEYPAFQMLHHFVPRLVASDPHFAALETSPTPRLRDEAFRTILDRWSSDAWTADDVEPVGAFVARVRGALEHAIRTVPAGASGARIGLVTSAGPIGVAIGLALGATPERMVRASITVRNASITELKFRGDQFAWRPDQLSLVTFNGTAHLPPELVSDR